MYGCESWSLTLREEHRLRLFENRLLRRIFRPKRDEATGEWRRLHNEELNDLYSSPNTIRVIKSGRMTWVGHAARMGEGRRAYRILVKEMEKKFHIWLYILHNPKHASVYNLFLKLLTYNCLKIYSVLLAS
jgi:hypothetical protein